MLCKSNKYQTILFTAILVFLSIALNYAQSKTDSTKVNKVNKEKANQMDCCGMDLKKTDAKEILKPDNKNKAELKGQESVKDTKSIVRSGIIDLGQIDTNKDGKVFQCPMDLNVISDEKGNCPECGMKLREISVDDAKAKLIKKGFKVK